MRLLLGFCVFSLITATAQAEGEPSSAPAEQTASASPSPDSGGAEQTKIQAMLQEIDNLYRQRHKSGLAEQSIAKAKEVLKLDPKNYQAQWRIARGCYWMADGARDKAAKAKWGKQGWDAGQAGLNIKPDGIEAQFWGAASLGNYAKGVGIMKAVWDGLGKKYEQWVRKAYKVNRRYAQAGPPRALGRYYFSIPGIAGGDNDKAIQYLEESKKLAPNALRTRAWLAEVYLDEGDKDKARAELESCRKADPHKGDYADNLRMQPECKRLQGSL